MTDIPADIVIYALVAAGLIFWLRSILGTRHGDEPQRPNPFVTPDEKKESPPPHASMGTDGFDPSVAAMNAADTYDPFSDETITANVLVQDTLREIGSRDRTFNPAIFLKNAEDAFVAIVEAFADGDKEFLKPMLSEAVYESFAQEIDRRNERKESVQTEIHAIRKAEITGAHLDGKMAYISVRIQAEETCIIKDEEENIISGNPNRATDMDDIWVFGRDLKSRDPVWRLFETHDGSVSEEDKTPIPVTD